MKEKEKLIEQYEKHYMNEKAYRRLIYILLNPQFEKLQEELKETCNKEYACKVIDCERRMRMKGHPKNCKLAKRCLHRVMDLGVVGEGLKEVHSTN